VITKTSLATAPLMAALAFLTLVGVSACQPASYQSSDSVRPDITDRVPLADIDWLESPRDWVGPSTALLTTQTVTPITDTPPTPALPVTITSDDLAGPREVTVERAQRIIAVDMAGSLAQTVWGLGLGDRLVGRDISTTFPGTEDLPVVTGTGHAISPESVLALRPDLILTDGTVGPIDVMLQLREAGVTVVFIDVPPGIGQGSGQALRVAEALGVSEVGQRLADRIDAEVAEVVDTIRANTPTEPDNKLRIMFLYLRGSSGIYYLFGSESGAGELITALGAIDVAGEIGWEGLRPVTDEALIAANPDLIMVMTGGLDSVGGVENLVEEKPAIGLTRAGQNLRFVDMADSEVLGFGPRTPLVLDALARAIYSPQASATPEN
jgi:iron complex transport system substrate-binding protein